MNIFKIVQKMKLRFIYMTVLLPNVILLNLAIAVGDVFW